jgi:hypothetical protein
MEFKLDCTEGGKKKAKCKGIAKMNMVSCASTSSLIRFNP